MDAAEIRRASDGLVGYCHSGEWKGCFILLAIDKFVENLPDMWTIYIRRPGSPEAEEYFSPPDSSQRLFSWIADNAVEWAPDEVVNESAERAVFGLRRHWPGVENIATEAPRSGSRIYSLDQLLALLPDEVAKKLSIRKYHQLIVELYAAIEGSGLQFVVVDWESDAVVPKGPSWDSFRLSET
jgi:hypothetical protein